MIANSASEGGIHSGFMAQVSVAAMIGENACETERRRDRMPDNYFQLNEQNMSIVREIGKHMPGGFFIYRAEQPEELLYANEAVFAIFGCDDLEDFKRLTGYTFRGMLHPQDYEKVTESINQ